VCPQFLCQLDFGVLLVNNQTTRDLTLVNNSDSDIRYELTYVCYPLSADGSPEKTEEPGLHVVPMLTQSKDHTLTVNLPIGVLPARSKTVTRVRLITTRRWLFSITLCIETGIKYTVVPIPA
jgi:hypothetical protein